MAIEFVLTNKGTPKIRLSENVIQAVDFYAAKYDGYHRQTKSIAMRLKFENANVLSREPSSNSENNEYGIMVPDEFDSVRNLLNFAISTVKMGMVIGLPYLDGDIKLADEHGEIVRFSYKKLFVVSFSEKYSKDTRNTFINIHMRERAR